MNKGSMQGGSALQAAPVAEESEPGGSNGKGIKRKLELGDC